MLKKFKRINNFFHPEINKIKMDFVPFVMLNHGKALQVMRATNNDIPALLALEQKVYAGQMPWNSVSFETEFKKRKSSLYLVVYDASTLVAMIGARFHPREAHITNIAVAPAYQGQHIAHQLLDLMIERARANHSECVSLEVRIDNQVAKALYRSMGFEATFIRKNYYQTTHTDAVNMVLWLKPHQIKRKKLTL